MNTLLIFLPPPSSSSDHPCELALVPGSATTLSQLGLCLSRTLPTILEALFFSVLCHLQHAGFCLGTQTHLRLLEEGPEGQWRRREDPTLLNNLVRKALQCAELCSPSPRAWKGVGSLDPYAFFFFKWRLISMCQEGLSW